MLARFAAVLVALCLPLAGWGFQQPPYSFIADVDAAGLPAEARATLDLIKHGGPFPYRKDGTTFQNRERRLPRRAKDYYREYTVPTPGARDRGARRIIAGDGGEFYYTDDHYRTFVRIRE